MREKKQSTLEWQACLLLVILVFALFMFDFISVSIGTKIAVLYQLSKLTENIGKLMATILVWGIGGWIIITLLKKKSRIDLFEAKSNPTKTGIITSIILVILMTVFMYLTSGGFKPLLEYQSVIRRLGSLGWIAFILQNIYYGLEMFLALLMCAFGQMLGEVLTAKTRLPWGSIVLGILWGLPHILSKNLMLGLMAIAIGIVLGLPYLLLNRNAKLSWIFMFLMFVL